MARQSLVESRSPSSPASSKPKPIKTQGIIILPPEYRTDDDTASTASSSSGTPHADASSLPDMPEHRTLHRSASTSTQSLNVRFAPLPQLAPRKRRSTTPLGIASRAQMMRRRRAGTPGYDMDGMPLPPAPPMWTDEEVERHTQRVLAERERERQGGGRERDIDDPLLMLGKMVKGVWRRVNSRKPMGDADAGDGGGSGKRPVVVVAERMVLATISGDNTGHAFARASTEGGGGGVWEEEVGERFPLNVGQTETIVEGQYSWAAAKLQPPPEDTGSVSDESGRERNLSSEDESTRSASSSS